MYYRWKPAVIHQGNSAGAVITLPPGSPMNVTLTEPLGVNHETQLVQITTTSALGYTPSSVKLGGVGQTFQVGADGGVYVLASLTPYQTLTYTLQR